MRISFSPERRRRCVEDAERTPLSAAGANYPEWYLQHWHFLPEGYLSRRSSAAYEMVIPRLYNALRERSVVSAVVERVRAVAPTDILELGCGPGHLLHALGRALPAARITGLDLSPFQLERAGAVVGGAPNVVLAHADATATPHHDGAFDVVLATHLFGHMPGAAAMKALGEVRRLLRPGARLLVVDHRWHPALSLPGLELAERRTLLGGVLRLDTLARVDQP